jgi:hypothetical protein
MGFLRGNLLRRATVRSRIGQIEYAEEARMERNAVRLFFELRRGLIRVLFGGFLMVQMVIAQTPGANVSVEKAPMARDASPNFLVATIKPSAPDSTGGWAFPNEGNHISCVNATVATIMQVAFGIHPKQIVGGPEWLNKDRYDINGVPDVAGIPDLKQTREMYQKLLADRFHLVFRREVRDISIYALTVAKGGPMLKVADPNAPRCSCTLEAVRRSISLSRDSLGVASC